MSPSRRRRQIGIHSLADEEHMNMLASSGAQPSGDSEVINVKTLLDRKLAALMQMNKNSKGKAKPVAPKKPPVEEKGWGTDDGWSSDEDEKEKAEDTTLDEDALPVVSDEREESSSESPDITTKVEEPSKESIEVATEANVKEPSKENEKPENNNSVGGNDVMKEEHSKNLANAHQPKKEDGEELNKTQDEDSLPSQNDSKRRSTRRAATKSDDATATPEESSVVRVLPRRKCAPRTPITPDVVSSAASATRSRPARSRAAKVPAPTTEVTTSNSSGVATVRARPVRMRAAKLAPPAPEIVGSSATAGAATSRRPARASRSTAAAKAKEQEEEEEEVYYEGDEDDEDDDGETTNGKRIAKQAVTEEREAEWRAKYLQLQRFKKKFGHCQVPKGHDFPLSQWVSTQRLNLKNYKNSQYKTRRVHLLISVGFFWGDKQDHPVAKLHGACTTSAIQTFDDLWMDTFEKLKKYKQENGHCNVPMGEDKPLSCWVRGQRALLRDDTGIKKERIQHLNSIKFDWGKNHPFTKTSNRTSVTRKGPGPKQSDWLKQFRKLKRFHAKWGNCKVPWTYHDKGLQLWARSQRRTIRDYTGYRKERAELLNTLGFDWGDDHPFNMKPQAKPAEAVTTTTATTIKVKAAPVTATRKRAASQIKEEKPAEVLKFKKWSRPNKAALPPQKKRRKRG